MVNKLAAVDRHILTRKLFTPYRVHLLESFELQLPVRRQITLFQQRQATLKRFGHDVIN